MEYEITINAVGGGGLRRRDIEVKQTIEIEVDNGIYTVQAKAVDGERISGWRDSEVLIVRVEDSVVELQVDCSNPFDGTIDGPIPESRFGLVGGGENSHMRDRRHAFLYLKEVGGTAKEKGKSAVVTEPMETSVVPSGSTWRLSMGQWRKLYRYAKAVFICSLFLMGMAALIPMMGISRAANTYSLIFACACFGVAMFTRVIERKFLDTYHCPSCKKRIKFERHHFVTLPLRFRVQISRVKIDLNHCAYCNAEFDLVE